MHLSVILLLALAVSDVPHGANVTGDSDGIVVQMNSQSDSGTPRATDWSGRGTRRLWSWRGSTSM